MVEEHRAARRHLQTLHEQRDVSEMRRRAERFRKGFLGLWDRVTGQHGKLRGQNEADAAACAARDAEEKQALIDRQLRERRSLQHEIRQERRQHMREMTWLNRQISEAERGNDREAETPDAERTRRRQRIRGPSA